MEKPNGGLLINIITHKCTPSSTCDAWSYCNHFVPLVTDLKDGMNLDLDDATDVLRDNKSSFLFLQFEMRLSFTEKKITEWIQLTSMN